MNETKGTQDVMDINNPNFVKAVESVPDCDVTEILKIPSDRYYTTLEVKQLLAMNRWMNRICDYCGYKQDVSRLKRCTKCCLVFYCNSLCQKKHMSVHEQRCGKLDGPLDTGFQQIVFIKISPK